MGRLLLGHAIACPRGVETLSIDVFDDMGLPMGNSKTAAPRRTGLAMTRTLAVIARSVRPGNGLMRHGNFGRSMRLLSCG
ncbi:MAG: hypothetical protein A2Z30_04015 [Chloroflexi bacterium RBG_16_64_43]|nr:MAG: hypothetical protein A2Z30_04015 [Chloroflexi bacterium RBG_16_64_43]